MSTRPVVFCTAASTSTVVSSFARTNAVTGAIESGAPSPTTVTRTSNESIGAETPVASAVEASGVGKP